jgi:competence transcription factor ComK
MNESEDAFRVSLLCQRKRTIVLHKIKEKTCELVEPHIIMPLIYIFASHWLVRAACIWLPWKDALRAACDASSVQPRRRIGSRR